jgi:hypothetical protein
VSMFIIAFRFEFHQAYNPFLAVPQVPSRG